VVINPRTCACATPILLSEALCVGDGAKSSRRIVQFGAVWRKGSGGLVHPRQEGQPARAFWWSSRVLVKPLSERLTAHLLDARWWSFMLRTSASHLRTSPDLFLNSQIRRQQNGDKLQWPRSFPAFRRAPRFCFADGGGHATQAQQHR
jgi:hypothetical protein